MRKLIIFLLIVGAGYYLYTHQELWRKPAALTATALKGPFAWKVTSREGNGPFNVSVELIDGSRWRTEVKKPGVSRIWVSVSDGSRAATNSPRVPAATLDPRSLANQILTLAARTTAIAQKISPQVTEQYDGHTCWRTDVNFLGATGRMWIDARSHFPVCLDATINGKHEEFHCSPLQLDFAQRSAEFFNTNSTEPLFSNYLTP